ncbi:hypothetical protein G6F68_018709 [Rhizopus microsporus]|nr:hypothetical protein G6F68_018709 [Rhizopus microsporus]
MTNSKRPINRAEDMQGIKLRVMQNQIALGVFNTLGANAVPMPFSELFTALETQQQVLRSAALSDDLAPRLHPLGRAGFQEMVGHAVARRAEADQPGRRRIARLRTKGQPGRFR